MSNGNQISEKFYCQSCELNVKFEAEKVKAVNIFGKNNDEEDGKLYVDVLPCIKCGKYVAIYIEGVWNTVENSLKSKSTTAVHGLKWVKTERQRIILWLLIRVTHHQREEDSECPFLPTSSSQAAKILWYEEQAVGFYTVHEKGSQLRNFPQACYSLPIVDLIYVREDFRRRGLAMDMLDDITHEYPDQNIGFSTPVSVAMYKVLRKYLLKNPKFKDYLWEVSWTGDEGFRKNIWLQSKRQLNLSRKRQHENNSAGPSKVS